MLGEIVDVRHILVELHLVIKEERTDTKQKYGQHNPPITLIAIAYRGLNLAEQRATLRRVEATKEVGQEDEAKERSADKREYGEETHILQ